MEYVSNEFKCLTILYLIMSSELRDAIEKIGKSSEKVRNPNLKKVLDRYSNELETKVLPSVLLDENTEMLRNIREKHPEKIPEVEIMIKVFERAQLYRDQIQNPVTMTPALKKTYDVIAMLGEAHAREVAEQTGREYGRESSYLNKLTRMNALTKRRAGHKTLFAPIK